MKRKLPLAFIVALVCALSAGTVQVEASGVPSPSNSTVPSCLVTCPNGDIPFAIVVRDLANNEVSSSFVVLSYESCSGFVPCAATSSDGYVLDPGTKTIRKFTGPSNGQVVFYVRAGGVCAGNLQVFADGVLIANVRVASTDQNGDLAVDGADLALVTSKVGTTDLTGDLDCDWDVDAADETLDGQHIGHHCLDPTGSRHSSWGGVKVIYR